MNFNNDKNNDMANDELDSIPNENLPEEKWIVALVKNDNFEKIYYRQFFATGFYEAYDRIMTFSEKTGFKILWYKEKWKCDYIDDKLINLESFCTFCNKKFNNIEPIMCNFEETLFSCRSSFCSFDCRREHIYYLHIHKM